MARRNKTIDRDMGYGRILKSIRELEKKPHVKVGYQASTGKKSKKAAERVTVEGKTITATFLQEKVTVLDVAIWNEFGTVNIPERSHIRLTYDQMKNKWFAENKKLMVRILKGRITVKEALEIVGLLIESDIKGKIQKTDSSWPPNAPSTIQKKKSSKPLIDTGQMLNSVRFLVVMKGLRV